MLTTEIWRHTRSSGTCRGCGAAITWAEVVKTHKWMPFTGTPLSLRVHETEDGRTIEVVDLGQSHFATCPDAEKFRKKKH
jgi:hypothetical protein